MDATAMPDRLISLCDPDATAYAAIVLEGERAASAVAIGAGGESLLVEDGEPTTGEGRLRIDSGDHHLEVELAAQTSQLAFETPEGLTIGVQAVAGRARPSRGEGFDARGVSWSIAADADDERIGAVRTIWMLPPSGGIFVLFAARPVGSEEHGSETLGAARISPEGEVRSWSEPLLSTEYGPDGNHRRATLELWDADRPADRGAGLRLAGLGMALGGFHLEAARFDWKLNGAAGIGAYEILGS